MQGTQIVHHLFPILPVDSAEQIGHEVGVQIGNTGASQSDLGIPPGVFLGGQIGILLADVHAADVPDLVVDGDDFAVAAVVGQIGLEADHLAAGIHQRLEHLARGGDIGDEIAHDQNGDPLFGLFGQRDQGFSHHIVVDGVKET